jgi:hypothetical protein
MARLFGFALASAALILAVTLWASSLAKLIATCVLLAWAIYARATLSRHGRSQEARRQALDSRTEGPLPPEALDYLTTVHARLELPVETRREVRAELADHLSDSIAAIQAEGQDAGFATREAIARLGRADDLARDLSRTHQSTQQLLAGAAGGVWSAGIGALQGYIFAVTIFLLLAILFAIGLRPAVDFVVTHVIRPNVDPHELGFGTALAGMLAWPAAFVAGRRGVQASAEISGRSAARLGRWWALAGLLGLGWLLMFVVTVQQSWLVVAFELVIPIAFAAGALFRVDSHLPSVGGRWFAVAAAVLVVASIVLGMVATTRSGSSGGSGWDTSYTDDSIGWNHVAPHWSDDSMQFLVDGQSLVDGGVAAPTAIQVANAPALASFRDLRVEAWRAGPYPGAPSDVFVGLLDISYNAPFATAPAAVGPQGVIEGHLNLSHSRTERWWIFLTGIAPDGQRYWLGIRPDFVYTQFSGTIWDWLTASN